MSPVVWLKSDFNRSILDIEVIELFTFQLFISYLSRPIYPTVVIMLRLLYHYPGKHTIFGRVCRGMEIIKRLGSVQTDNNDRPIHDVKILRASVKD